MMKRYLLAPALNWFGSLDLGVWSAAKNTLAALPTLMIIPYFEAAGASAWTPNLIAMLSAIAGAGSRWLWFRLSLRDGLAGMIVCPVAAFAFATLHPPFIDSVIGSITDHNYALMLGFALGMFPTVISGWVQDFFIHRRGGSKGEGK